MKSALCVGSSKGQQVNEGEALTPAPLKGQSWCGLFLPRSRGQISIFLLKVGSPWENWGENKAGTHQPTFQSLGGWLPTSQLGLLGGPATFFLKHVFLSSHLLSAWCMISFPAHGNSKTR